MQEVVGEAHLESEVEVQHEAGGSGCGGGFIRHHVDHLSVAAAVLLLLLM